MFKVGDEVFIKAEVKDDDGYGKKQIEIKGIDGLLPVWFEVYELIPADKTYEQGLADAWNLAKKILNMKLDVAAEVFDSTRLFDVMDKFTPQEALAKIEAYEKEKEIKVGDEVIHETDSTKCQFVVTYIGGNMISGIEKNGDTYGFSFPNQYIRKTGKHIDIESLLRQIGE